MLNVSLPDSIQMLKFRFGHLISISFFFFTFFYYSEQNMKHHHAGRPPEREDKGEDCQRAPS